MLLTSFDTLSSRCFLITFRGRRILFDSSVNFQTVAIAEEPLPRYRVETLENCLQALNSSCSPIDHLLVTSPNGLLGLPYLHTPPCSVYCTEVVFHLAKQLAKEIWEGCRSTGTSDVAFHQQPGDQKQATAEQQLQQNVAVMQSTDCGGGASWNRWSYDNFETCCSAVQVVRYGQRVELGGPDLVAVAHPTGTGLGHAAWVLNDQEYRVGYVPQLSLQDTSFAPFNPSTLSHLDALILGPGCCFHPPPPSPPSQLPSPHQPAQPAHQPDNLDACPPMHTSVHLPQHPPSTRPPLATQTASCEFSHDRTSPSPLKQPQPTHQVPPLSPPPHLPPAVDAAATSNHIRPPLPPSSHRPLLSLPSAPVPNPRIPSLPPTSAILHAAHAIASCRGNTLVVIDPLGPLFELIECTALLLGLSSPFHPVAPHLPASSPFPLPPLDQADQLMAQSHSTVQAVPHSWVPGCTDPVQCFQVSGSSGLPSNSQNSHLHHLQPKAPVPLMAYVGPVARQHLGLATVSMEWLGHGRQQRAFAAEPPFDHEYLLQEGTLVVAESLDDPVFTSKWQEPLVVFVSHPALQHGPGQQLFARWSHNPHDLLLLTSLSSPVPLPPPKPLTAASSPPQRIQAAPSRSSQLPVGPAPPASQHTSNEQVPVQEQTPPRTSQIAQMAVMHQTLLPVPPTPAQLTELLLRLKPLRVVLWEQDYLQLLGCGDEKVSELQQTPLEPVDEVDLQLTALEERGKSYSAPPGKGDVDSQLVRSVEGAAGDVGSKLQLGSTALRRSAYGGVQPSNKHGFEHGLLNFTTYRILGEVEVGLPSRFLRAAVSPELAAEVTVGEFELGKVSGRVTGVLVGREGRWRLLHESCEEVQGSRTEEVLPQGRKRRKADSDGGLERGGNDSIQKRQTLAEGR